MKTQFSIHVLLLLICLSVVSELSAQSIERSVISSMGNSFSGATLQADITIGETITATASNGNLIITQGFQQPHFTSSFCFGDFDNNGVINIGDLLLFTGDFGCMSACGVTDMDDNGAVNTGDLLLFLSVFGSVCP